MSKFNAQRARAKRPCPLWVDAFQRDTQHLEADEVGAYMLILMAMWTRETCDFPNDPTRLARVARVSLRLWKSRIGPAIMPFLTADGDAVFSKRLRQEASYVERQVKHQSNRKVGENSDNPLIKNNPYQSTDISVDEPRNHPSQQPNNPTVGGKGLDKSNPPPPTGGGGFSNEDLDSLYRAVGFDPDGHIPAAWRDGAGKHFAEWVASGLSPDRVIAAAKESRKHHPEPPANPKALRGVMDRALATPVMSPVVVDQGAIDARNARNIKEGKGFLVQSLSPSTIRGLIEKRLVTEEDCQKAGVRL